MSGAESRALGQLRRSSNNADQSAKPLIATAKGEVARMVLLLLTEEYDHARQSELDHFSQAGSVE